MPARAFMVVGVTHVDLAWKWTPDEMSEMLEVVVVRVLDALESDPDFKYTLEQAAHYRALGRRRPDLIRRLGPHLRSGRLEFAGAMASTLDTNLPAGESYVRNQLLGLRWVKETWGITPRTGWLMDTFGINPQVPQILRQFGMTRLVGSRFGGDRRHDAFVARGLDGSEVTVLGRDCYCPSVDSRYFAAACYRTWADLDQLFGHAEQMPGDGPVLVHAATENEYLLSLRPYRDARDRGTSRPDQRWSVGTHEDFFDLLESHLEQTGRTLPVEDGDLNPEFTGCFSLRVPIRLRNRRAEGLVLEAEQWACFAGLARDPGLTEAWWDLAFVQFHDVFTGSHPTAVYQRVIETFDCIDAAAARTLDAAAGSLLDAAAPGASGAASEGSDTGTHALFNGLPWPRQVVARLAAPGRAVAGVTDATGVPLPFEQRGDDLFVLATLPPCAAEPVIVTVREAPPPAPASPDDASAVTLENEHVTVNLDRVGGLRRVVWKETGRALIENAGGLLVAQQDDGNFQIESPAGGEVPATAGPMSLRAYPRTPLGQTAVLAGRFPSLSWAGPDAVLAWELELTLRPNAPGVDLTIRLDWKGEGTRVRLRVPTTLNAADATYEVPFGTTRRRPYGVRGTARGEWPAQRFVTVEDATHGLALANDGAAGVEVVAGALLTTLLRAPKSVYAGMTPDETSSAHGRHTFRFALVPYRGTWSNAAVLRCAQELNAPPHVARRAGRQPHLRVAPQLSVEPSNVVLSSVKWPEDGTAGDLILRLHEAAGHATTAMLRMPGVRSVSRTTLAEGPGTPVRVTADRFDVELRPFEILTLRASRG